MFFNLFNFGRKKNAEVTLKENVEPVSKAQPALKEQESAAPSPNMVAVADPKVDKDQPREPGRQSLTKLKSVAKGQRVRQQNQAHWFSKNSSTPEVKVAMPKPASHPSAPLISEEERRKAIDELLSMGCDHYTGNKQSSVATLDDADVEDA